MIRRLQSALILAVLASALPCAHALKPSSALDADAARKLYLHGARSLQNQDYSAAEKDFTQAVKLDPANQQYVIARDIVVSHHATALIQAADKAKLLGHADEARADLMLAYRIDPKNPMIAQHIDEIAHDSASDPVELYPQNEDSSPPIDLAPAPQTHSFHLNTSAGELLRQVVNGYGIAPTIDSSVKEKAVRFDADDVSFDQAARMVQLLTNTFFVPLDPRRVLIAEDTKENRSKYQRLAYETVYFPGSRCRRGCQHGSYRSQYLQRAAGHSLKR